ncbi:GyrI-like domain-containing protein [Paenibacillus eucommiae]|uniref:Effector-binding domain-containing protein n=1 Tax=Paenibacillus eucommiae TaxID=1355755 RepID=A0ABS4J3L9_9BACL|nr:GyrI-like domain-containing protein [Paenibacillus eucommiae]MBP1994437.1 effector-binding domain-containing protein [Paenibacillus eucommiae]
MDITIFNDKKAFLLYGVSKIHEEHKEFSKEIFEVINPVWAEVKEKSLSHKGINHVVYDVNHILFAGIELNEPIEVGIKLKEREFVFEQYAYYKHIGPYNELDDAHRKIRSHIEALGREFTFPILEIYENPSDDETKLETEILYTLKVQEK